MRQPHQRFRQPPLLCLILILSATFGSSVSAKDPELLIAAAPFEVLIDGLKSPTYLTIDPNDQILLSERAPGRILQVASDRTVTVLIDNLKDPEGLVVDPDGALFVAAKRELGEEGKGQKGVILRRDAETGAVSVVASEFKDPRGLALDLHGTLFVSAQGRRGERDEKGAVYSIDASSGIALLADGFTQPQGVLIRPDGNLIVASERVGRRQAAIEGGLFQVDPTGQVTPLIQELLRDPFGVARDPVDGLYVTARKIAGPESEHGVILKRRPDGQVVTFAQGLRKPRGLAFDSKGNLYVVEAEQKRVLKFLAPAPPTLDPVPPDFTNQATVLLQGTTEPGSLLAVLGGLGPVAGFADAGGAFSLTVSLAKNTANTLLLFTIAAAGDGLTSAPTSVTIVHDDLPPTVAITSPANRALLRGAVPFSGTASDSNGIALVTLQADGTTIVATNAPPFITSLDTTTLQDGTHTFSVIGRDRAGNEAVASVAATTDNTAPTITIAAPGDGSTIQTRTPTLQIMYSDATSGVQLSAFHATLDGSDITTAFTLSPTGATATLSTPLASGPHTLQAQIADQAGNAAILASAFTVAQTLQVAIITPADGTVVAAGSVLISGSIQATETDVGVTVNGIPGAVQGNSFAALVPVTPDTTTLTAVAMTASGTTASHSVAIAVTPASTPTIVLHANPQGGVAPLTVAFSLLGAQPGATISVDFDGNGTVDVTGLSLEGQVFTYPTPGLYFPTVTTTDTQGNQVTIRALVQVYDQAVLDASLRAKWSALKDALRGGGIGKALDSIALSDREGYRPLLTALGPQLSRIDTILTDISPVSFDGDRAVYQMIRIDNGIRISHFILFVKDADGIWRLKFF